MTMDVYFERIQNGLNIQKLLEQAGLSNQLQIIEICLAAAAVAAGLLLCFLGLKLVRVWGFLYGLALGSAGAALIALQFTADENVIMIAALASGIILGILLAVVRRLAISVCALLTGFLVSIYLIQPQSMEWFLLCVGIGVILLLLSVKFSISVIMLLTAVSGALLAENALEYFVGLNGWMKVTATIVLGVLGFLSQIVLESGRRKKLNLLKAAEIREQRSTQNEVDKARALLEDDDEPEDVEMEQLEKPECEEQILVGEDLEFPDEEELEETAEELEEDTEEYFLDDEDDEINILEIDLTEVAEEEQHK